MSLDRIVFAVVVAGVVMSSFIASAQTVNGAAAAARIVRPRCELAVDPAGVDTPNPRLFWQIAGDERGLRQSAYQILVSSSKDLLSQGRGDLWDSGKVDSDETTYVKYAGAALASSQEVFWKVRAWDGNGRPSAWSEPARWTMGLLSPADWKGVWIKAPSPSESLLLRRSFAVKPGLRRAVIHVSGLGQYELTINGAKTGDDLLTPGWTDYRKTVLYDTFDVTAQVKEGPNAVGLALANGMYHVVRVPGRFAKFEGTMGEQRAIAHLVLEYADGSREFVGTDGAWRTLPGPITFGGIYGGEDYDARRLPAGWNQPGFDDGQWSPAAELGKADKSLRGMTRSAEPVRAIEKLKPVKAQALPDRTTVYDFGQNASFMPRVLLSGPAGSTVRLIPAEAVNPDGSIWRGTMGGASRGSSWWQYTKATDGEETWFPQFYYVGGRYLRAELVPPGREPNEQSMAETTHAAAHPPYEIEDPSTLPKIESIESVVVHSTAAPVGTFSTSDEMLNRVRGIVRWAQRSNIVSIITDCPHREKLGWLEQQHMNGPSIRYEFDLTRLFAKAEDDMADAQDESGLIPNVAPEYVVFKGAFRSAAEWGAAFIAVPYQQYEFDGDVDLLRRHYPAMKRYFAYLESRVDAEGILSEGLGDWYDLGPAKPGKSQLTHPPVTATAFLFEDARMLAEIAGALGASDDAKAYAARAAEIRKNYNKKFFDAANGTYATNTQCSNALPLALGIVEAADRERVLAALVRDVERHEYGTTAGDVGFRYVLRALADGGRSDVVYKMIKQDSKPGYGYQVKHGETTLTESWDANRTSSHNHFMLGHVTEWFYRDLAGIGVDPAGMGFKKIVVRPNPVGDLGKVEASYDSIHGPITSKWEHAAERFALRITVPANTTATVYVPARDGTDVREGSTPADQSAGVKFLRRDGDRAVYAVESGSYIFESTW